MRLADDVLKIVAFLGWRTTDLAGETVPKFGGTGFFVSFKSDVEGVHFTYLVTCRHVAEALGGPFIVGVNDDAGKMDLLDVDVARWYVHPDDNIDIAITQMGLLGADWRHFPSAAFAENIELFKDFGAGDLVYIIGLYRLFPGRERISPVVHTGHVAMTPSDSIPVKNRITGRIVETKGYLIEAQTLDGLSGSPVLIRFTNPTGMFSGHGRLVGYTETVFLLGVWQGSWDGAAGEILRENLGSNARVPVGMGITIPASKVMEVLQLPELQQARAASIESHKKQNPADMG